MLHLMRKHASSWLIKVVLAVIVIVFVLWGSEAYRAQRGSRLAVVNGETISIEEYRNTYERLVEQYRRQFGDALDSTMLERLNLRKQALDSLIERRLLVQRARAFNMSVSDDEIIKAIQGMSVFQQDGRFDSRLYQRLLAANRITPESFEEGLRQDLIVERMQGIVQAGAKVSDAEVYETFKWQEGTVRIDYVLFETASKQDLDVSEEEMNTFFSENQSNYKMPPRLRVGYVAISSKDRETEVVVTDEEVEQYFELNRDTYDKPKKVRARHILFKVDADASDEKRGEVLAKAEEVLRELRDGADFAEMAQKHSQDPGSEGKGGDLGFFTREQMVPSFSDAAFSLKPGDISEPVSTRFGWHLIKVEEIQEAQSAVLENVAGDIRKKLVADGARNLAYEKAESLYSATYSGAALSEAAKADGLPWVETDFFAQGEPVKGINQSNEFSQTAFTLNDDEVNEPLAVGNNYYVMQVIERQEARFPDLSVVKDQVQKDVIKKKREEAAQKGAEGFLARIKEGKGFEQQAMALNLEVKSTESFKRFGSIPGIGFEQSLNEAAFSLGPSNPLPENAIKGKKGFYIIRFKEAQIPDEKSFEAKKQEITSRLLAQKRQQLMMEWYAWLRQQGEVVVEEGYIN